MAKILMVDDDQEFLAEGKKVLTGRGYEVATALNVREAEQKIKSDGPDLVFLDIMMESPDDGIALAHRLRQEGFMTPIVMLSSVSKVSGYKYGTCSEALPCNDFLEKPIASEDLIKKAEAVLNK